VTSPMSPLTMISHRLFEIPANGLHNRQFPFELLLDPPPEPPEVDGVAGAKTSVIMEATASLAVRVGKAQLFSIT